MIEYIKFPIVFIATLLVGYKLYPLLEKSYQMDSPKEQRETLVVIGFMLFFWLFIVNISLE